MLYHIGQKFYIEKVTDKSEKKPNGTFLIPPEVEQHDRKEHQSFFGFQNTTNDKTKTQYERLFNGDDSYDAKTHRDDRAHAKSKV